MGQLSSRLDFIHQELSNHGGREWIYVHVALRDATLALAASMHAWIGRMHKQIKRVVPAHDPCSQNCSQVFSEPEQWCGMCFTWHREILALASPEYTSRVVWSRFRSKDWPSNPYEVARVFIPRAHRFYYRSNEFHEDIRFTLCFLENCTLIHVSKDLIQKAWVLRNSFLRRGRMKAKRTDLNRALSVLISLLQVPEISEHEAVPPALEKLKIFQNTSEESVCIIL